MMCITLEHQLLFLNRYSLIFGGVNNSKKATCEVKTHHMKLIWSNNNTFHFKNTVKASAAESTYVRHIMMKSLLCRLLK